MTDQDINFAFYPGKHIVYIGIHVREIYANVTNIKL